MKLKRIFVIIIVVAIAVVSGCTANNEYTNESSVGSNSDVSLSSLQNKINEDLTLSYSQNFSKTVITFSKVVTNGYISQFTSLANSSDKYEGVVYAIHDKSNNWTIVYKNASPVDLNVPFTHMEMSSKIKEGTPYSIVSGVINNSNISYLQIQYVDGVIVKVMVSPKTKTYAYIRTDSLKGAKSIKAFSEYDNLIYEY